MIPLTGMTSLLASISLTDEVPDPADVKPGWLGFGVFLLLAAAVVVLWFSFRKQLRKVNFEEPTTKSGTDAAPSSDASGGTAESDRPAGSEGDADER